MKPLFGGSSADSSRLFLLRSTRSLTAYSILSEQSKREEVDEILMKSGELNEILETSAEHEEEEVFGRSVLSKSWGDRDQTAFEMPERFQSSLGRWVTSLLASLLFDRCDALGVPHLHCLCPQFLPTRLHHVDQESPSRRLHQEMILVIDTPHRAPLLWLLFTSLLGLEPPYLPFPRIPFIT
jgi:hypothetical protein